MRIALQPSLTTMSDKSANRRKKLAKLLYSSHLYCFSNMRLYNRKVQSEYRRTLSNREANILSDLSYKGHIFFTPKDLQAYDSNPRNIIDSLSRKK